MECEKKEMKAPWRWPDAGRVSSYTSSALTSA